MTFLQRLKKRQLCKKYGICPTHFTLMDFSGGYYASWNCKECDKENAVKHSRSILEAEAGRERMIEAVKRLDAGKPPVRSKHWIFPDWRLKP